MPSTATKPPSTTPQGRAAEPPSNGNRLPTKKMSGCFPICDGFRAGAYT
ncbi:MAG: hypothetical protein ACOXZH_00125 [Bacteroidales bacterium]